jgi:hypothetical protein
MRIERARDAERDDAETASASGWDALRVADQVRLLPFPYLPSAHASHKNSSAVLARCLFISRTALPHALLCSRGHERALLSSDVLDDAVRDARGRLSSVRRALV